MNKYKWLVVSNIVLVALLLSTVLVGCSSSDSRVDWAVTQIQTLQTSIAQLQTLEATVNQNTLMIQNNTVQISTLQANLQSTIEQLQQYLQTLGQ